MIHHFKNQSLSFANFDLRYVLEFGTSFSVGSLLALSPKRITGNVFLFLSAIAVFFLSFRTEWTFLAFEVAIPIIAIGFGTRKLPLLWKFGAKGDVSYGLYLYAYPIQQIVVQLFGTKISPVATFFLELPTITALAYCSWRLIEKPMLKLRPFSRLTVQSGRYSA